MNKKKKNSKIKKIRQRWLKIFGGALLFFAFYFQNFFFAVAEDCQMDCEDICSIYTDSDQNEACQNKCRDDEKECQNLEKKAKIYENILKLNNKQQDSLTIQIDNIAEEKEKTENGIKNVKEKIFEMKETVEKIKRDIFQKEKDIEIQKKILSGLIQSYYDYDQQGILGLILFDNNLPHPFIQSDYIEQSEIKVNQVLENIQNTQKELKEKNEQLQKSHEKNLALSEELFSKKDDLLFSQKKKQSLLNQTQGEEQKYKDLLAHIEEQKKELFDFSLASNISELLNSVSGYGKPENSDKASTTWYFSQQDSRWGTQKIGNSNLLMKDYGCAVTSVAMVFRKFGASVDPKKLAREKIFYSDLIKWPTNWNSDIKLISSVSHGNVNWSKIDAQIKKGDPVIVHIYKTNGRGGHYVVITGKNKKDYIVHDPYFGPNIYLGTSRSLVGKLGSDSGTRIDQMIIYDK